MQLELDDDEREVLAQVLQSWLAELSHEIADTDSMDFREGLKAKRRSIQSVVAKIREAG